MTRLGVIIPAYDEEESVAQVVKRTLNSVPIDFQCRVVVTDNASRDSTRERAMAAGSEVISEEQRGYGAACLAAIQYLADWPQVYLFLDADGSSRPEEMGRLLAPILSNQVDLVIGCRPSALHMTPPQRWGTRLAIFLVQRRWGHPYRDMGPFRAIRRDAYERLGMKDRTWGWTVEMQILALLTGLRVKEVEVSWDARLAGVSKISGSVLGVLRAGTRILLTILYYSLRPAKRGKF